MWAAIPGQGTCAIVAAIHKIKLDEQVVDARAPVFATQSVQTRLVNQILAAGQFGIDGRMLKSDAQQSSYFGLFDGGVMTKYSSTPGSRFTQGGEDGK